MSFPPSTFEPILTKIAKHLTLSKQKISVAETAAGGLISASLLSVPEHHLFAGGTKQHCTLSPIVKPTRDGLNKILKTTSAPPLPLFPYHLESQLIISGPTEEVVL